MDLWPLDFGHTYQTNPCNYYMHFRDHKIVQERLFGSMDRLLDLKVAIPDVAELLTEV